MSTRVAEAFSRFLSGFASYTKRSHRTRLEPCQSNLLTAFLAKSVITLIDPGKSGVDLGQKFAFPVPNTKQKIAVRLKRRAIGRVSDPIVILRLRIHRTERALGFIKDFSFAAFKEAPEEVKIPCPHTRRADAIC